MAVNKLNIMSLNCRGLANREKRQDLFSKMKDEKYDICLLQDVHWTNAPLILAKEEWEFKIIGAPFNSMSRGTAILINTFEFHINKRINDENGNYSLVEIVLPSDFAIVTGSIYAPNTDNPTFIHKITEEIQSFEYPNILLCGDWNSTRNFELDNLNYVTQNNMKMTKAIDNMCTTLSLKDGWRVNNTKLRKFTWNQGIYNKQGRLDFILCSDELLSITQNFEIKPKYRSDHSPVTSNIILSTEERGPGIWRKKQQPPARG